MDEEEEIVAAGDNVKGGAMTWTVDFNDLPDPPKVFTLSSSGQRSPCRPKGRPTATGTEAKQLPQHYEGPSTSWTIDAKDLRDTQKKPEPKIGKNPIPTGAIRKVKKELVKTPNTSQPKDSRVDTKREKKEQQEKKDDDGPITPMLSENEKKMLERIKEIRADKQNILDPKIELEEKPKPKAPKMSISKARTELSAVFLSEGRTFKTEERKIREWYCMYERRFEAVERIHKLVPPKYTFENYAGTIKQLLAGQWTNQLWGLRMLRGLAMEISYEPKDPKNEEKMLALLKDLNRHFEFFLAHERTQLITEVCVTVSFLCREYRDKLEMPYLKTMITNLLHKTHVHNLIGFMVKATLKYIFQYVHVPLLYMHLMKELEKTRGQKMKIAISYLMLSVMEYWSPEEFKPCLDAFEQGFKILYSADIKCHVPLRLVFWIFNRDQPERANKLYSSLKELDQILLDTCKFIPPKQLPQEELLPPVKRDRPFLIDYEDSEEEKKEDPQNPEKEKSKQELPKDKKNKKKKKKKRYSSSSSSDSDDSSSSSSDSSEDRRRKRKRRKEKRKKKLKKQKKAKKSKKTEFVEIQLTETSISDDMEYVVASANENQRSYLNYLRAKREPKSYFVQLKEFPSKLINMFKKSKPREPTPFVFDARTQHMIIPHLERKPWRRMEEISDVVTAYEMGRQELHSTQEELASLKLRLLQAKDELEFLRLQSHQYAAKIRDLEGKDKYRIRRFSDPEVFCRSKYK